MENQARTLPIKEAARLLGMHPQAVYRAAVKGDIPVIRVGGRVLVLKEPLERMLAGAPMPATVVMGV